MSYYWLIPTKSLILGLDIFPIYCMVLGAILAHTELSIQFRLFYPTDQTSLDSLMLLVWIVQLFISIHLWQRRITFMFVSVVHWMHSWPYRFVVVIPLCSGNTTDDTHGYWTSW